MRVSSRGDTLGSGIQFSVDVPMAEEDEDLTTLGENSAAGDTPLHLAVRHGNRPASELMPRGGTGTKGHRPQTLLVIPNHTEDSGLDEVLGLNSFHYPIDQPPQPTNHQMNYIRALADMFACPHTSCPITVGLFSRATSGVRTTYLQKLIEELTNLTLPQQPTKLRMTFMLGSLPVVIALTVGYIFGLAASWHVGLAMGLVLLFLQVLMIALILFGSYAHEWSRAIQIGHALSKMMESLRLLLRVLFCYPSQEKNMSNHVKVIFTHVNLSVHPSALHAIVALVEKIWQGAAKKYSSFLTRLQRHSRESDSNRRFKRICCIPTFIFILVILFALLINLTLLRIHETDVLKMFANRALLAIFILLTCIVFLGFFGTLPRLYQTIRSLVSSPTGRLRRLVETPSLESESVDALTKAEFKRACQLLTSFDRHLGDRQTRVVVCIDATDAFQQEKLAQFIHLVYNLLISDQSSPVAVVIAADFQVLLGDVTSENLPELLSDSYHLVHSGIHLPLYMDQSNMPLKSVNQKHPGASFESLSTSVSGMRYPPPQYDQRMGATSLPPLNPTSYQAYLTGSLPPMYSAVKSTLSWNGPTAPKTISELYVGYNDMTELNAKIIKHLVAATAFTGRLLRLNQMDFRIEDLVIWLSFSLHWPYHAAWLSLYIEEQNERLDGRVTLGQLYDRVLTKITKSQGHLKALISDDRDPQKLDIFVRREAGNALTVADLRQLIGCSAFMNPYLGQCIRDILQSKSLITPKTPRKGPDALVDEGTPLPDSTTPISAKNTLTWPRPMSTSEAPKTPSTLRRCLVKLKSLFGTTKDGLPGKHLSQLTIEEVGKMLAQIEGVSENRLEDYKTKLRELNITGLVLSVCDMEQLRPELGMTFGDWQLFNTLINHLREMEAMAEVREGRESAEVEEIADLAAALSTQVQLSPPTGDQDDEDEEEEEDDVDDAVWKRKRRTKKPIQRRITSEESEDSSAMHAPGTLIGGLPQQTFAVQTLPSSYPRPQQPLVYPSYSHQIQRSGPIRQLQHQAPQLSDGLPQNRKQPTQSASYMPYKETTLGPQQLQHHRGYTLPSSATRIHPRCQQHPEITGETVALLVKEKRVPLSKSCHDTSVQSQPELTPTSRRRKKLKLIRSLSQSQEKFGSSGVDSVDTTITEYRRYIPVIYQQEDDWDSEGDCTCEYWYRLEKEGKVVVSEPASRANSRPITSPELSDEGGALADSSRSAAIVTTNATTSASNNSGRVNHTDINDSEV